MKINKDTRQLSKDTSARQLHRWHARQRANRGRSSMALIEKKPRNYIQGPRELQTPVASRSGEAQRHDRNARRELAPDAGAQIVANLKRKYGSDLADRIRRQSRSCSAECAFASAATSGTAVCAIACSVSSNNFNLTNPMSSILEEIETQIAGLKTSTSKSNVGVVRETGDGVARIEGLSDVMLNEMIEFSSGVFGLALNLEETEVGAILLGDTTQGYGRRRSQDDRQASSGPGRQSASRPRREHARPAARWQGADQIGRLLIRWKKSRPASSSERASASRCRPASWRSTR